MRYHIYKASELYNGSPYNGPASNNQPAETDDLNSAFEMSDLMTKSNPVGWVIHDTFSKKDIPRHRKIVVDNQI